ncbi:uncharacterized protein SPAPADRAFT_61203 [Spathaspora passalidarum NRRL Y-27907]|uniref:Uncharacterized protein n=1 Tax=Spathaspora passalidarum (strain NRRL Y-27907 / 11-Y1) TaxID=619300 RepID=G3APE1_SPAPN|nr:uncharacterized protein SPAPADRAFT_61203 [Spathaspora passalidarum NRRL Y-27907]EGW32118.1 hypothetical protein SPAPADRAFT_61203 [Spathaspora passalidarum NRRL Y-27907]
MHSRKHSTTSISSIETPSESEFASSPLLPPPAPPAPHDRYQDYYDAYASHFMEFLNESPTTYHVITHFKSLLENNGFTFIPQTETVDDLPPGYYFTSRDDQCLVAFIVGGKWKPENGSCFVGCHVDALTVKLNPRGSLSGTTEGYETLGVAPYSGSLNKLWLNRDLGLAGSILVRQSDGKIVRKLISSFPHPIGTIPSLAPHFGEVDQYNKQTKMVPVMGYLSEEEEKEPASEEEKNSKFYGRHSLSLLRYICKLADVPISSVVDIDLQLDDVQPAQRGGLSNEFIFSPSLDDRLCSYSAIYGLIEFSQKFYQKLDISTYEGLAGVYLANNEEIGSATRTGAGGGLLIDTFKSIVSSRSHTVTESLAQLTTNTVIISSDVTHALNPNFQSVYLKNHAPFPNTGPCIKLDSNFHVLSDSPSYVFLQQIMTHLPGIKLQQFHIRNDSRSGGTIGPIMSNGCRGINGARIIVDVGLPILSMHSIRGMCGYKDVGMGCRFFKAVFEFWQDY